VKPRVFKSIPAKQCQHDSGLKGADEPILFEKADQICVSDPLKNHMQVTHEACRFHQPDKIRQRASAPVKECVRLRSPVPRRTGESSVRHKIPGHIETSLRRDVLLHVEGRHMLMRRVFKRLGSFAQEEKFTASPLRN
jgi:hypothetical protein